MGAKVVDYRVSTLVVLCKDCGNDVGLYPARHKCRPVDRPAMPSLPIQYNNNNTISTTESSKATLLNQSPSVESPSTTKSTQLDKSEQEDSVYYNNFAAHLPESTDSNGKKLWGKIKQNEKWKQLNEKTKDDRTKQSGKLWGKLLQATQTMAEKIPSREDRGAESDEDDWEGETHVSRILRDYYERKRMRLPEWLLVDNTIQKYHTQSDISESSSTSVGRTPSRRRLWEQDPNKLSSRERERQELRQKLPIANSENSGYKEKAAREEYNYNIDQQHNYRKENERSDYYNSSSKDNRISDERATRNIYHDNMNYNYQQQHLNSIYKRNNDDRDYSPRVYDPTRSDNRYDQHQHNSASYYKSNSRHQQAIMTSREQAAQYHNGLLSITNGRRREPNIEKEEGYHYSNSGYF
ncbi:uncharacterized protein BX663DRAFT_502470 [Cokeromyces recurvatus]|uniref:uncharacterized protein n=1 Tax=Cokeromyces recurvatus TaxID=90255 RepID=UPI0022206754|nr:uncharacterized protein BX663DRAFT_502470 [Cokeromyces recurvatus]KAI7905333.1 hypothetical protein BX663DRAFT_502470 [Cokeromyces recurvatus]